MNTNINNETIDNTFKYKKHQFLFKLSIDNLRTVKNYNNNIVIWFGIKEHVTLEWNSESSIKIMGIEYTYAEYPSLELITEKIISILF